MPFVLIVCAALAATGIAWFEPGLSLDGPLYASIARHVAGGDVFLLKSGVPPFEVFHEHPHLYFWISGLFVKVFGASDWVLRLFSMSCYATTLAFSWRLLRQAGRSSAFLYFVVLLILMTNFGTWHMNAYIDPLMLTLAVVGLDAALRGYVRATGVLGALILMTKGLAALAVGPALFVALCWGVQSKNKSLPKALARAALVFALVLTLYIIVLDKNGAPDFVRDYLTAQGVRTQSLWAGFGFLRFEFWRVLSIQTLGFCLSTLWLLKDRSPLARSLVVWAASFVLMLAGSWRVGAQYFLPLMWVAAFGGALMLSSFDRRQRFTGGRVRWGLAFIFGVVFLLGQSSLIAARARTVPVDAAVLGRLVHEQRCKEVASEVGVDWIGELAPLVWYSGVDLISAPLLTTPVGETICVLTRAGAAPTMALAESTSVKKVSLTRYDLYFGQR